MADQFKFNRAESDSKLIQVLGLGQAEYPELTQSQTGELLLSAIKKDTNKHEVYYFEHKKTGEPVSCVDLVYNKGFFKDADKSSGISSTPNPDLFGVKHITILQISRVYTSPTFQSLGLGNKLINQVVEHVEQEIIKNQVAKSDSSKSDSFSSMVKDSNGSVDAKLANYYLSKLYFWVIYSSTGNFFERFGFKSYETEMYKIPTSIVTPNQEDLVQTLLSKGYHNDPNALGKKLRLLDFTKHQDRDLISFMLQNKELNVLTELNKSIFHSELTGGRKSSSSLTNVSQLLNMTKLSSTNELSSINESSAIKDSSIKDSSAIKESGSMGQPSSLGSRRKSSVHVQNVSKFAIKPDLNTLTVNNFIKEEYNKSQKQVSEFDNIQGAIFTNDLQQKSYYILWTTIRGNMVVIGVGDLQFDFVGTVTNPGGASQPGSGRRRGSSFTGINELGGYNFQDLDILFSVAASVGLKTSVKNKSSIYVTVNDLPGSIPAPMLNDYFLFYLPKTFDTVESNDSTVDANKVELLVHGTQNLGVLPMVKMFGSTSNEFELDWIANGLWSYMS